MIRVSRGVTQRDPNVPQVAAIQRRGPCRVCNEQLAGQQLHFTAEGIADSPAVICITAKSAPKEIRIAGQPATADQPTFADGVLCLRFANSVDPIPVEVRFEP
jgi:hypothetical protein